MSTLKNWIQLQRVIIKITDLKSKKLGCKLCFVAAVSTNIFSTYLHSTGVTSSSEIHNCSHIATPLL